MIKFEGELSGSAKKYFQSYARTLFLKIWVVVAALVLLGVLFVSIVAEFWGLLIATFVFLLVSTGLVFVVTVKQPPFRIFIEDEYVVYQCDSPKGYEEYKKILEAEKLIDYGEFYHIVYPIGNMSDKFICQKDLLVEGTLEDFEAYFQGKIVRIEEKKK